MALSALMPLTALMAASIVAAAAGLPWSADRGDGTYQNPVLHADYSDPDVVRVGDEYVLVASSFHEVPGLPLLVSRDLVNWTLVGHAAKRLPSPDYDLPRHGRGVWAPSIRHHGGLFWVFFGDPDLGLFVTRARDPRGPWEPLHRVAAAGGWIDPCPFWDDDGTLWVVHAWAKSRAGFNGILTLRRLSPDGRSVVGEGIPLFDGGERHPTIEGPKVYRREGWVYVFAPAGGVKTGWQTVLRSRSILGPFEARVVLQQGTSPVNGPHQGALVEDAAGDSWFVHFQDRGPYGRVTHLQPVTWKEGWPVIGEERDGGGAGQPVPSFRKPSLRAGTPPALLASPQASDEFVRPGLSPMWQWNANPKGDWMSLSERPGFLRLRPLPAGGAAPASVWLRPNVLVTRFPEERFTATALVEIRGRTPGAEAGLAVLGRDTFSLSLRRTQDGWESVQSAGHGVDTGGRDEVVARRPAPSGRLHLRVAVEVGARLRFSTSVDGTTFEPIGEEAAAREGVWIGARLGLFAGPLPRPRRTDAVDFDWFRIEGP